MITKKQTERIKKGLIEIFGAEENEIHCLDKTSEGNCLSIAIMIEAIDDGQFDLLKRLTDSIPNPLALDHQPDGIRLFFFSTDVEQRQKL